MKNTKQPSQIVSVPVRSFLSILATALFLGSGCGGTELPVGEAIRAETQAEPAYSAKITIWTLDAAGHVPCVSLLGEKLKGNVGIGTYKEGAGTPPAVRLSCTNQDTGDYVELNLGVDPLSTKLKALQPSDLSMCSQGGAPKGNGPKPPQTTLGDLPSGDFAVDSFFDITYQIDFDPPTNLLCRPQQAVKDTGSMAAATAVKAIGMMIQNLQYSLPGMGSAPQQG